MTTVQHKGIGSADQVPPTGTRYRWLAPALVVAAFLAIGGALGGPGGKLADVQKNDSAAYLPSRAESAAVLAASTRFSGVESTPAIVVYSRPSGLTDADKVEMTLFGLAVVVHLSPVLPFVVLAVAGTALGMANGTAYLLAKAGLLTISGDAQGILDVLVLGAATDYALLLTARYREELRRHEDRYEAMRIA